MMKGSMIIMLMLMLMMIIHMNVGVLVIQVSFWNDEEQVKPTSGEDDSEKKETLIVLEKFRVLLGLSSSLKQAHTNPYSQQEWLVGSPAPSPIPSTHHLLRGGAPAPAPGPIPASAARVKPHHHHHHRPTRPMMLPIQRLGHHHKENGTRRRVIIAVVLVSIGVGMLICSCGVLWVTKRVLKHQKFGTKSASLCGEKGAQNVALACKVRHDPGFGLYHPTTTNNNNNNAGSVCLELEPQICVKETYVSLNETEGVGDQETKQGPRESKCSFSAEEIISVHEYAESSKYESEDQTSLKADNFRGTENHNSSSEDESFHSLCDSRSSSNLRLSNVSLGSLSDPAELSDIDDSPCNRISRVDSPSNSPQNQLEKENPTSSHTNNISNCPPPPPPPPPRPPPSTIIAPTRANLSFQDNSARSSVKAPSNIPPPPCPPPFQSKTGTCSKGPPPPPPFSPMGKDGSPLPKLKPLHWDKVRAAPDRSMVWDQLRCNSFELDEEMIESLFGYNLQSAFKNQEGSSKSPPPSKHVLEPKRLQNITILSKALNVTPEKVCEALVQGEGLGAQQLEALVKMAPTKEEEAKLTSYKGNINELGSAEKLVKKMLIIPHAFQRIEAMLYRATFDDEVVHLRNSFSMLEEACKELRSSRLFLKLLEAVLKTGNRMNVGTIRGGARAFKLDALLKLADVKGTDGKTSLLHFVVQEIIRSEGIRMSDSIMGQIDRNNKSRTVEEKEDDYRRMGLELVSGLSTELCNVKRTASIDLDVLATSVSNLTEGLNKLYQLLNKNLFKDSPHDNFVNVMKIFMDHAEKKLSELQTEEEKVLLSVRQITEYYHGGVSKDEVNPLRIFVIVRDFMGMLDQVCRELRTLKTPRTPNPLAPFK